MSYWSDLAARVNGTIFRRFGAPAIYRTALGVESAITVITRKSIDSDSGSTFLVANTLDSEIRPVEGDQMDIEGSTYSIFRVAPADPETGDTDSFLKKRA